MGKKIIILLLCAICASPLFAMGAREIAGDETAAKVLSTAVEEDGTYVYTVQRTDGTVVIYRATESETAASVPFAQITEGSTVAIKDNGIATMSIPAQMFATEIRDITLGQNLGIYGLEFAPVTDLGYIAPASESTMWTVTFSDGNTAETFSYSYGYDLSRGYTEQGVTFRGSYFARGVLDFYTWVDSEIELLIPIESMSEQVNLYVQTFMNNGIEDVVGPEPASLDEIYAIAEFSDLSQRFSYAYGFITAYQDYYQGITVDPVKFIEGFLTASFGDEPLLDESEREAAIQAYVNEMMEQYYEALAVYSAENLAAAEAFLAENATVEGVITTDSGLQYEVVRAGDGATPTADDTVVVNYTLRDIDGNLIESNSDVQFALSGLIAGFSEAVQNMQVGGEVIAYIHPSLGYGENGAGSIGPNALIIFDIELTGIVE